MGKKLSVRGTKAIRKALYIEQEKEKSISNNLMEKEKQKKSNNNYKV